MFESVVLRRKENGEPISAGQVAEALLFYQKVHVVIDRGTLAQLVRQIGISSLIALTQRTDFSAVYTEENLGTVTNDVGILKVHGYAAFTLAGSQEKGSLERVPDRLQFELERLGTPQTDAKKFARAFLERVPARKLSGGHFISGGIPAAAHKDLLDAPFSRAAVRQALIATPGGYDPGEDLKLDVVETELGTYVFSSIDFDAVNRSRAALHPPQEAVTIAHLLSTLLDARADLSMAAHYGGDFVCSSATSAVIQVRHELLLQRTLSNRGQQKSFLEVQLPDMPTIAEAIDSGERSFDEFLKLLDKSARFKLWLKSTNPDEGLVREYFKAATAEDWIQTNKAKGMRYAIAALADATNPIAGVVAGLADNFIIERLLGGWRPSHFVNDRLKPFVNV